MVRVELGKLEGWIDVVLGQEQSHQKAPSPDSQDIYWVLSYSWWSLFKDLSLCSYLRPPNGILGGIQHYQDCYVATATESFTVCASYRL